MLKSHFNLVHDDEEQVPEEQPAEVEDEPDEEDVIPERNLNKSEVSVRLSMLGKTAEGDGYTYLKATITGLKLTKLRAIKSFTHIMFLDVSNNLLDIEALQVVTELPFLILLHADKNRLTSAGLKQMRYLQVIIMNDNQITAVNDVFHRELSTIEVANNQIKKIEFNNEMKKLRVLDFRYNLLTEITNFDFPILDSLYLAGNKITSLVGLEKLVNLRILHVRFNPIKLLNGFDEALTKLQYINLRNCKVSTLKQIKKLRVLKGIEAIVLKGCPYMGGTGEEETGDGGEEDDPELRIEVLAALPRLKKINKELVSPEEREEAKAVMLQWLEDGENDIEELEEEIIQEEEHTNNED